MKFNFFRKMYAACFASKYERLSQKMENRHRQLLQRLEKECRQPVFIDDLDTYTYFVHNGEVCAIVYKRIMADNAMKYYVRIGGINSTRYKYIKQKTIVLVESDNQN